MKNPPSFLSISKGKPVLIDFKLPEPARTHVMGLLGLADQDPRAGFVEHAEFELGRYVLREDEDRDASTVQDDREQLKDLQKTLLKLKSQLDRLSERNQLFLHSMLARQPTYDETNGQLSRNHPLQEYSRAMANMAASLHTLTQADAYQPKRGARPKSNRAFLIEQIVKHYKDCFQALPSSASGSAFEQALAICLESVGITIADLHKEILQARKRVGAKNPA